METGLVILGSDRDVVSVRKFFFPSAIDAVSWPCTSNTVEAGAESLREPSTSIFSIKERVMGLIKRLVYEAPFGSIEMLARAPRGNRRKQMAQYR
jgi:hypothetical protein